MNISRREFLALAGAGAVVAGCATNPVTGKKQLMLFSEQDEIRMDKNMAPHQFSAHYGASQDRLMNDYVVSVGEKLFPLSHRPHMPYNVRVTNAPMVNAYTFPAGSMTVARGLMVEMETEAQLASVLGHEIGHVAARHTGARMSWAMVAQLSVALLAVYLEEEHEEYAAIGAGLGMVGANLLLCRYSREDERQADSLGLQYMTTAGHHPKGMPELMEVLIGLHDSKPSAVEVLFATHPLSEERRENALKEISDKYSGAVTNKEGRERYMDHTANLRKIIPAVKLMQQGEEELMKGEYARAQGHFQTALRGAPDDYAGLLLMSKSLIAQKKYREAEKYAVQAHDVYPSEPQALHIAGVTQLELRKYQQAFMNFDAYEQALAGNPNTVYFKAVALDGQNRRQDAADHYYRYLKQAPSGEFSGKVKNRLKSLGYAIPGEQV